MSEDFEIRNLTDQDIIPLVRICNQTFLEGARFPDIGSIPVNGLEKHPEWQWGAFLESCLAGFAIGLPNEKNNSVHLRLIGIDPAFRGQGLGSRLLKVLEEKAQNDNREYVDLGTPYAREFYEKNGYTVKHITYRMLRDITRQSIVLPENIIADSLAFEQAAELTDQISDSGQRLNFLKTYLRLYGKGSAFLTRVSRGSETVGIILGQVNDRMPDMARVDLMQALNGTEKEVLVQAFEYAVSTRGLRYVGFDANEDEYRDFESWGYAVSHEDHFWTQYSMEKRL